LVYVQGTVRNLDWSRYNNFNILLLSMTKYTTK